MLSWKEPRIFKKLVFKLGTVSGSGLCQVVGKFGSSFSGTINYSTWASVLFLSSEPSQACQKLKGFAEIWAQVVSALVGSLVWVPWNVVFFTSHQLYSKPSGTKNDWMWFLIEHWQRIVSLNIRSEWLFLLTAKTLREVEVIWAKVFVSACVCAWVCVCVRMCECVCVRACMSTRER